MTHDTITMVQQRLPSRPAGDIIDAALQAFGRLSQIDQDYWLAKAAKPPETPLVATVTVDAPKTPPAPKAPQRARGVAPKAPCELDDPFAALEASNG